MEAPTVDVAAEVRAVLARKQMSQRQLATALGVTQPVIWRRMRGEVPFTGEELQRIASVLDVSISSFFGETSPTTGSVQTPAEATPHASAGSTTSDAA